ACRAADAGAWAASSACAFRALRPSRRLRAVSLSSSCGWLGRLDSNQGSRDQNPLPYHLATPQRQLARSEGRSTKRRYSAITANTPAVTKVSTSIQYQRRTTITARACEAARTQETCLPSSDSSI